MHSKSLEISAKFFYWHRKGLVSVSLPELFSQEIVNCFDDIRPDEEEVQN